MPPEPKETGDTAVNRLSIGQLVELADGRQARVVALPNAQNLNNPNATVVLELLDPSLAPFQRKITMAGGTVVTPLGQLIGFTNTGEITDTRDIPFDRFFGADGTGGSTAFSSTQAAAELRGQQAQDEIRLQAKLTLENDIANDERRLKEIEFEQGLVFERERQLLAMRIENSQRELLLSEIGAERRTLITEKGRERERQTGLAGKDIFKFTANLRGRSAGNAPTPVDVFKQPGQQFINQPLPQFDINASLPELQAGLSALQKLESPQGQGLFGLAHGGTIEMELGTDGRFQKRAYFVGENPDGTINDTTEILVTGGGKVEVIPLAGGAAHGMEIGDFNISNLNLGGFPDLLSFLRQSTGVGGVTATPGLGGRTQSVRDVLLGSQAAALGAFQLPVGGLFQSRPSGGDPMGAVFTIDERGQRRGITPGAAGAFDFSDVQFLTPEQIGRVARGADISDPNFQLPLPSFSEFGAFGQPLNTRQGFLELAAINPDFSDADAIALSNRIGFLPSPHKIAQQIGIGGVNLDNQEISGLLSLYGLAGVPRETFFRQIEAATPTGRSLNPQRIGFQGARF